MSAASPPQAPMAAYRAGLEAGELRFQRCRGCEAAVFYPRLVCPVCGGSELSWETAAGEGTVYATTAMAVREGDPYNVALVDLDEGFRMMSRVDGIPSREVEIGARVRLRIIAGEEPVPVFVPAGDGS